MKFATQVKIFKKLKAAKDQPFNHKRIIEICEYRMADTFFNKFGLDEI
jgi:hypothetical protein